MYKYAFAHKVLNMFENMLTNPTITNNFTTYFFCLVAVHHYNKQRQFLIFIVSHRAQERGSRKHPSNISHLVKSHCVSFKGMSDSIASLSKSYKKL